MTASIAGSGKVMVDTNVLFYCYDEDAAEKHRMARELVRQLVRSGRLVVSIQVVNELYSSLTHKRLRWSRRARFGSCALTCGSATSYL